MHYLYLVLTKREKGETMEDISSRVEYLLEEEGFTSQGYFSSGKSDWFEIGGRWSDLFVKDKNTTTYSDYTKILDRQLVSDIIKEYPADTLMGGIEVFLADDYEEIQLSDLTKGFDQYFDNNHTLTIVDYHN